MIKIYIDADACIGAASCVAIAGKTFFLNAEGKAECKDPAGEEWKRLLEAERNCPTRAIRLESDETPEAEGRRPEPVAGGKGGRAT